MINEKKLREAIIRGAEQWRRNNKELLSCFDQDKLWETIQAFNDLQPDEDFDKMLKTRITYGEPNKHNIMRFVIAEEGPDQGQMIEEGIALSFDKAFLTLWDRGALQNLLVVDEDAVPPQAQHDIDSMASRVEAAKPAPNVQAPPPPPVDPVATCVEDFHKMGSKQFQAKYLSDTRNRRYYEAAIDRGLL